MKKGKNNIVRNSFAKKYWTLVLFLTPMLAFADDFKTGVQKALGVGIIICFIGCVFFVAEGIIMWRQGGNYGRDIIGLIVAASCLAIVTALFTAFGLSGAAVTPTF